MVYGVIVAGGIGSRMAADKPKQFLMLKDKPIIVHTVEKFYKHDKISKVIVLVPNDWVEYTEELMDEYFGDGNGVCQGEESASANGVSASVDGVSASANGVSASADSASASKIIVISGGETRNETIMNSINYIEEKFGISDETIIVTHDSVRPFVSYKIIDDNIQAAAEFGAVTTAIGATDTILECSDEGIIERVPDRAHMYQCQTPQTFKALRLREMYLGLSDEKKAILTDATGILMDAGDKVHVVMGDKKNIKITVPSDMKVAEVFLDD
ncbi:MAG: 2-C-methyl-D-erythritol 4-phosphate cytidylyltransferase [Lachnospiraceae bacterium]|nr:2-C-methyl-D-erythritol 4-phosphate cytidylyltransferase [Lachnospiraceae bacterium]